MADGSVALAEVEAVVPEIEVKPETVDTNVSEEVEAKPEVEADGKGIPQTWRDLFKQDSKLRGVYFAEKAFREAFPEGPNQAKQLASQITELTTEYGVQSLPEVAEAMQSERQNWAQMDEWYEKGDPAFVKSISEEGPEQFAKMMPQAVDQLASINKPAYDHLMSRIIVNTIDQTSPMAEIYNVLAADEKTKPIAAKLAEWYNGLKQLSDKQPERKENPEAKQLQEKLSAIEQKEQEQFKQHVSRERAAAQSELIDRILKKEFARTGKSLDAMKQKDPDSYHMIRENCNQAIGKAISKDDKFLKQYVALLNRGDSESALRLAKSKIDNPEIGPKAIINTYALFERSFGKPSPKPPQPGERKPVEVALSRPPAQKDIDWGRIRATYRTHGYRDEGSMVADGKVYVKGRKELVSF